MNEKKQENENIKPTIITVGNGGYNIAADMIAAGIFRDFKLIVCDSDADDLKRNSENADCSFLLDSSIEQSHPENLHTFKQILDEATDVLYLVAALGGKTSRIFLPQITMKAEKPGRFIWHVISFPANYEGPEAMKRSRQTLNCVISFSDIILQQENDKLPSISELTIGEMNKPIVETLAQVSQFDVRRHIRYKDSYNEFIPVKYCDAVKLYKNFFKYPRKEDIS